MKKLHHVLRTTRENKKLTLRDIERKSRGEISNGYLCQIESGAVQYPTPEKLKILARILKLNFVELLILSNQLSRNDIDGYLEVEDGT